MAILDPVKKWIYSIGLKKGIKSLAKLIVSYATAKGIAMVCTVGGIAIDLTDIGIMTAALNSGFETLRNFLKVRYPEKFSWL